MAAAAPATDGTWTAAPMNPGVGQAFGLWLLTDGTVLSHGQALNNWVVLVPDAKGSYVNGTWKAVASSVHARGGAQQHVLRDGRFFQAGGEYIDGPDCTTALCPTTEIYDPVANTWTPEATAPYDIGDTGSATLADGRILDSTRSGNQIQIYNPVANKWTVSGTMPLQSGDENSWASLQNGGVLAVGYQSDGAAIYNPATGKWIRTGPVPSGFNTGDTGGISQMFDGRVFVYGLSGQSYIYTPGATAADPGAWVAGPKMLNGDEAEDEFSDTLPNGKVWGGLVTMTYGPGVVLQQFDPTTNMVYMTSSGLLAVGKGSEVLPTYGLGGSLYPTPHPHGVFELALHRLLLLGLLFWGKQTNFAGRDYTSGVYDGVLIVPQAVKHIFNETLAQEELSPVPVQEMATPDANADKDGGVQDIGDGTRSLQRTLYLYWSFVALLRDNNGQKGLPLVQNGLLALGLRQIVDVLYPKMRMEQVRRDRHSPSALYSAFIDGAGPVARTGWSSVCRACT